MKGLLLSHAYVVSKSAGYRFRVNKLDGARMGPSAGSELKETIAVDVVDGIVLKSWVDEAKVHT